MADESSGRIEPPFFGTRIVADIPFEDLEHLMDLEALFAGRWQLRQGAPAGTWEQIKRDKAVPVLARLMPMLKAHEAVAAKLLYGYFRCEKQGNCLIVMHEANTLRFDFPRERTVPHRCVADFFPEGFVTMQIVTIGNGISRLAASEFAANKYSDAFYLKGLAATLAEATAEYCHSMIRRELGIPEGQGQRFSPGYPSFPDLMAQKKIFRLLAPSRIRVVLSETVQLVPEYSTSAIISIDKRAVHFRP